MARVKKLDFVTVPMEDAWKPVGDPPGNEIGSTYDPIFRALDEDPDMAVKITKEDSIPLEHLSKEHRRRIQAGLKGIGNNKTRKIETKVTDSGLCSTEGQRLTTASGRPCVALVLCVLRGVAGEFVSRGALRPCGAFRPAPLLPRCGPGRLRAYRVTSCLSQRRTRT